MQLTDPGYVKRIRGTAYTARVSPSTANRVVDSVRFALLVCTACVDCCRGVRYAREGVEGGSPEHVMLQIAMQQTAA